MGHIGRISIQMSVERANHPVQAEVVRFFVVTHLDADEIDCIPSGAAVLDRDLTIV